MISDFIVINENVIVKDTVYSGTGFASISLGTSHVFSVSHCLP